MSKLTYTEVLDHLHADTLTHLTVDNFGQITYADAPNPAPAYRRTGAPRLRMWAAQFAPSIAAVFVLTTAAAVQAVTGADTTGWTLLLVAAAALGAAAALAVATRDARAEGLLQPRFHISGQYLHVFAHARARTARAAHTHGDAAVALVGLDSIAATLEQYVEEFDTLVATTQTVARVSGTVPQELQERQRVVHEHLQSLLASAVSTASAF